jgi:hypothetical protein
MAEEATTEETETTEPEAKTEQTVPYERFQQANAKAKAEAESRRAIEKKVAELTAALEERENAGLPELDRMKKDLERVQKRAEEAEAKAAEADTKLARSSKERWIVAAAKDFNNPSDAIAFVDLDGIEDEKDAERAVKALAKRSAYLLKSEDPKLPGKVLAGGQAVERTAANGHIERAMVEAEMLASGLKQFASPEVQ